MDEPKKNEDSPKELEIVQKQAEEYLNGWKRAKADYINFKREAEKKQKELIEFATAGLLLELLPLVDQFKQAFRHLPAEQKDDEWIKGIRHIQSNLNKLIENFGIKEIKTVGEKFNPEQHEAVGEVESDQDEGTVVEEVKTGFRMHDKVLIPAEVKVSKKKSQ
ncbi:MAG: nucleotide exchange factor GrpE [Candidatus Kerfeldbacteria bacterium CG_4_10_14_0_8_um_filter_42_10]|uniref:Protein GrpE n=1 Tax=Candidatus Kerfeldbacteria bacterium CG_4_10_14_0_8_um_filter_42_10 TaxID=2014248 RepID=A0A2M7RGB7_9BACT|nr:MAG: nucleotide exchange factor GrpE [Candidatus Kerfeldbacteria bacterium CG_4_10_14_0_8_um_filter_42_10]